MGENKAGATRIFLVQQHFAIEPFGNNTADGQSQACSLYTLVQLFKPFEDRILLFGRYSASRVGDGKLHEPICPVYLISQFYKTFLCNFGRIPDQVDDDLLLA